MRTLVLLMTLFAAIAVEQPSRRFGALLIAIPPDVLRVDDQNRFTPRVSLDLYKLTSIADGVLFDVDGDGSKERVAWTPAKSEIAFVALDRNDNGLIENGTEIIGNRTVPGKTGAIDALRSLNMTTNGGIEKGSVDDGDALYRGLLLWSDRDHDGVSTPQELRPLATLFTKIGLGYVKVDIADTHGNMFRHWSWAELRTAPGQGNNASTREDHEVRLRFSYEVLLGVLPTNR